RTSIRRAGGRGRRARRGGDRLSTSRRADPCPWHRLRRHDSARSSTNGFFLWCSYEYGYATGGGRCTDPLPLISRCGTGDHKSRADTTIGTVVPPRSVVVTPLRRVRL